MKWKTKFSIIAVVLIVAGFGMATGGKTPTIGNIGCVMIGVGSLYLIYVLFQSMKDSK